MESSTFVNENSLTLPAWTIKSITVQAALLVSAAFLLPAAVHSTGLPVRLLLPMHWPVLLVGLCYGWRAGVLVGLAAPGLSFLISGHPLPHILPAMTLELGAYGLLAGLFREKFRLNGFFATALALVGGRMLFIAFVFATVAVATPFAEYLWAAMLPGIPAAIAQIVLLPILAKWWVSREQ
ncbi:MAG TPA: ECF transporter S component [Pyrinomonadaceae bacterium]|nr:ECF transporter S component [Pyrinomonadaceae bacterium]